ncbi:hypothetical protein [Amycolatopsis vastitatis]|uniref:hypothetical protein n=1 Tax=Amycolatopsis vastitatis TaxID=1905142 RepID=UPI0011779B4C|nr:hypothetical protein [Amycolatopsis vastitatis]
MTQPHRVTEEQVTAAQLRLILDEKQGRSTPEVVRSIANSLPGDEVAGTKPSSVPTAPEVDEDETAETTKEASPSPYSGLEGFLAGETKHVRQVFIDYPNVGVPKHFEVDPSNIAQWGSIRRRVDFKFSDFTDMPDVLWVTRTDLDSAETSLALLRKALAASQPEEREQIIQRFSEILQHSQEE